MALTVAKFATNKVTPVREETQKKTVLFGSIDPNVGGWTQAFINHCFYGIFEPLLPKISGKFTVKMTFCDPNISFSLCTMGKLKN